MKYWTPARTVRKGVLQFVSCFLSSLISSSKMVAPSRMMNLNTPAASHGTGRLVVTLIIFENALTAFSNEIVLSHHSKGGLY